MVKVSLTKTGNRRENVLKALKLIENEVKKSIGSKQIIIKPNFVSSTRQLAATHVDHVKGILDFLKPFYKKKIIIAEAAHSDTNKAFKNFAYLKLTDEYNVELKNLNKDGHEIFYIIDSDFHPIPLRIAKTFVDPKNYIISAAKLKSHDTVVVTLSLKNIVMGSMINDDVSRDKRKMHQGIKEINYNLFSLAQRGIKPDLAVIDGFMGMEGNGPVSGDSIEVGVGIASIDFLAADRIGVEIMGVDFSKIGYLNYCMKAGIGEADLENIEIIGEKLKDCVKKFKLHDTVKNQYKWERSILSIPRKFL